MYLEKWYADRVHGGRAHIRYLANLHWGPVRLGYTRDLQEGAPTRAHMRFGAIPTPTVVDGALHWPAGDTPQTAIWTGAEEHSFELARDGDLAVTWSPIVANGYDAEDDAHAARGYVERLALTLPPWRLGLAKLKWGRFCGSRHSLVWIEWQGRIPRRIALLDRAFDALLAVARRSVVTARAKLKIGANRMIVSEAIGAGAPDALGVAKSAAIADFLAGIETKWIAPATLQTRDAPPDSGYVIHEEVVWP